MNYECSETVDNAVRASTVVEISPKTQLRLEPQYSLRVLIEFKTNPTLTRKIIEIILKSFVMKTFQN